MVQQRSGIASQGTDAQRHSLAKQGEGIARMSFG